MPLLCEVRQLSELPFRTRLRSVPKNVLMILLAVP